MFRVIGHETLILIFVNIIWDPKKVQRFLIAIGS